MYRVQYFCPREAPTWQDLTEAFLIVFRSPAVYPSFAQAQESANSLLWRYHSARVIDPAGRVVYQV